MANSSSTIPTGWYWNRWCQLVLGLIAMMAISSPQYVWTLFTGPLNQKLGTTLAELQWTFSLLIILQTWCSPLQAYLVDRFGPRLLISIGALMSGGGWILSSYVNDIWALYFTYGVICGFGTGIIYVGIIGLMVRWFPDRRGLATGLAAAGYGFGAIFTSFPIDSMIKSDGYARTLSYGVSSRASSASSPRNGCAFLRKAGNRLAIHRRLPPRCSRSAVMRRRKC